MSIQKIEEKIECLKNLLSDPDDWISYNLLTLNDELEAIKMVSAQPKTFGGGDRGRYPSLGNGRRDASQ